ncbi:MAG: hypothetical protein ACT4QC_12645 [Planctomycetaceae bacterium]
MDRAADLLVPGAWDRVAQIVMHSLRTSLARRASRAIRRGPRFMRRAAHGGVSLIMVLAIVAGELGVPVARLNEDQSGKVSDAVASGGCGCANAGTRFCCCAGREIAAGTKSCCAAAAPQKQAAAPTKKRDSKRTPDPRPAFVACSCGDGSLPGLIVSHQPRIAAAAEAGRPWPTFAAVSTLECLSPRTARLGPEPPPPRPCAG